MNVQLITQLAAAEEYPVLRFTISRRRSRIADNIGREVEDPARRGVRSD
jgi:hypothetical protein